MPTNGKISWEDVVTKIEPKLIETIRTACDSGLKPVVAEINGVKKRIGTVEDKNVLAQKAIDDLIREQSTTKTIVDKHERFLCTGKRKVLAIAARVMQIGFTLFAIWLLNKVAFLADPDLIDGLKDFLN